MLEKLKEEVYEANMSLVKNHLVILTWGNVSAIDRETGYVVIKPSGVEYDSMSPDDMVVVDKSGNVVEGKYKPSSDTPTHLALYAEYSEIGGVTHTHSKFATVFAQANPALAAGIPALGTTHADYFNGVIPVTRLLKKKEIFEEYEKNTGLVIIETLKKLKFTPEDMHACLVASHGPFTWGKDAKSAAEYSYILENVAELAYLTRQMTTGLYEPVIQRELLEKHFYRKHGKNAYYGQN